MQSRPRAYPGPATGNRSRPTNGRICRQPRRYACRIFVDRHLRVSMRYFRPNAVRALAPQKLQLRCGPLHPCVRCCPDLLCRDFSSILCGSLPARPPGACVPLQLGLSAYMLWLQCMLTVPGCICCLLCMPASQCTLPDIRACACGHASRVVTCFPALSALCRPPSLRSARSTILGFSHTSTPSSIL